MKRDGTYATVGGSLPRLLQAFVLRPVMARIYHKHMRVVALKPNKDLAYLNGLFEAGKLHPVIDTQYELADLPEALRRFGEGDHRGKIIVTMA